MNAAQQAALEAVVERSLTPAEIIAIDQLLPLRNDVEIAAILSADRFIYVPHEIGERGIIDALGPVAGDAFLSALEAINSADLLPLPLQASSTRRPLLCSRRFPGATTRFISMSCLMR